MIELVQGNEDLQFKDGFAEQQFLQWCVQLLIFLTPWATGQVKSAQWKTVDLCEGTSNTLDSASVAYTMRILKCCSKLDTRLREVQSRWLFILRSISRLRSRATTQGTSTSAGDLSWRA